MTTKQKAYDKPYVKAYLSHAEKQSVKDLVDQANITTSELVRRLVLGQKLPEAHHDQNIRDLVKVAAGLARLGNLFKLALDDEDFNQLHKKKGLDAFSVMQDINQVRGELKQAIREIRAS